MLGLGAETMSVSSSKCRSVGEQSGPKAFRIVTRAETIAIRRRNIVRLDAAIESWTSTDKCNGTIEPKDIDKVIARRDKRRRRLDADGFAEPSGISFVAFLRKKSTAIGNRVPLSRLHRPRATAGLLMFTFEQTSMVASCKAYFGRKLGGRMQGR